MGEIASDLIEALRLINDRNRASGQGKQCESSFERFG